MRPGWWAMPSRSACRMPGWGTASCWRPLRREMPGHGCLLAALRIRLPRYMVPLAVDWRDALPRNANGKFDRERLRLEFAERFVDVETEDPVGPADTGCGPT